MCLANRSPPHLPFRSKFQLHLCDDPLLEVLLFVLGAWPADDVGVAGMWLSIGIEGQALSQYQPSLARRASLHDPRSGGVINVCGADRPDVRLRMAVHAIHRRFEASAHAVRKRRDGRRPDPSDRRREMLSGIDEPGYRLKRFDGARLR